MTDPERKQVVTGIFATVTAASAGIVRRYIQYDPEPPV